ncbi:MAG: carbamoyl-phosphate synthase large subunit [Deltaproteobacteria bacterium]|nr:MAG: carbamoyl-phosphate synthase large subunit [Deltaproteobacteria bacterium]
MPKRTDIRSILLIGSGPIVIGQACEFDYSGTQACKALREEGYRVILVNSNPATIMTDPEFADRTYIEPMTVEVLERIIAAERPDALLPTIGGQTGLNLALDLAAAGVLERHGVELIGARVDAIRRAEDRDLFKETMASIGLDLPRSGYARSLAEAEPIKAELGLPVIIRPSRTLGGTGGSFAATDEEFRAAVAWGLDASPVNEVLLEESIAGWKEFELEVMRDGKDNVVIVCSIENFDPMGVHTGDSITVAPAQTLTDKEYQVMRDAAVACIRAIGVDTGGSNIQFAVEPTTGRQVVIEMNPRVSRSSALASKATGFPIAKIAAKLAVGYTLDEVPNDITRETPACFEPTIDYVVTKIPRFTFEKFPQASDTIGPQMKSVGEAMAIGRTFKESLQKAMRSLEIGSFGFEPRAAASDAELRERLRVPNADRLWHLGEAFRRGLSVDEVFGLTAIDPWFLRHVEEIVADERALAGQSVEALSAERLRALKQAGFADVRLAELLGTTEDAVRARRTGGIEPVYKTVDTCGAEFEAHTPYLYSTYEEGDDEVRPSRRGRKVVILGGGPNRIGQGIEFDYCCVHAALALREDGFETIMVNCNPETVSTDYDTSDKLFFEPLTLEDTLALIRRERPDGVIVQFGGQTPLRLSVPLARAGVPIVGTTPDSIDRAEDRERFEAVLAKLDLRRPPNGLARSDAEAIRIAEAIRYPVLVRPSYVLGGRAMEIVYDRDSLARYMRVAVQASPAHPVLIDKFLEDAIEVDVDAVSDGTDVVIGGIMEHIERAGVHSGDSACSLPPYSIEAEVQEEIRRQTVALARELCVVGLMNVQFAVKAKCVFVLEVNPRASRTVPFVSKAIGVPLAKIGARCMVGRSLLAQGFMAEVLPAHVSVKEAVFPFIKFPGVDTVLGPEMKSTGEVMGIDGSFGAAFAKAQVGAGTLLPTAGRAFLSVPEVAKDAVVAVARRLAACGFTLVATRGTAAHLRAAGLPAETINKVQEGSPHIVDALRRGEVSLVVNTPAGAESFRDSFPIRRTALECRVPYFTTIAAAAAAADGIALMARGPFTVRPLQEHHRRA